MDRGRLDNPLFFQLLGDGLREANVTKVLEVLDGGVARLVADGVGVAGGHAAASTLWVHRAAVGDDLGELRPAVGEALDGADLRGVALHLGVLD